MNPQFSVIGIFIYFLNNIKTSEGHVRTADFDIVPITYLQIGLPIIFRVTKPVENITGVVYKFNFVSVDPNDIPDKKFYTYRGIRNIHHTFNTTGIFNVTLVVVANETGRIETSKLVNITKLVGVEKVTFNASSTKFAVGVPIRFEIIEPNASIPGDITYKWYFGTGRAVNKKNIRSHGCVYKKPGNYSVYVVALYNGMKTKSESFNVSVAFNIDDCKFRLKYNLDKDGRLPFSTELSRNVNTSISVPLNRDIKIEPTCKKNTDVNKLYVTKVVDNVATAVDPNKDGEYIFSGFQDGRIDLCFVKHCTEGAGGPDNVLSTQIKGVVAVPGFLTFDTSVNGTIGEPFSMILQLSSKLQNDTCIYIFYGDGTYSKFNADENSTACEDNKDGMTTNDTLRPGNIKSLSLSHLYDVGGKYILRVILVNGASRENIEIKIDVDFDPCFPRIQISPNNTQANPMKYLLKDHITYSAIVTLGKCSNKMDNEKLWTLKKIDISSMEEGAMEEMNIPAVKINHPIIRYKPRTLSIGFYQLSFNISMTYRTEYGEFKSNEMSTYLVIIPAPVFAVLYHSQSEISLGVNNSVVLDPKSFSVDNNHDSLLLEKKLRYNWTCHQPGEIVGNSIVADWLPPDYDDFLHRDELFGGCFRNGPGLYQYFQRGSTKLPGKYLTPNKPLIFGVSINPYESPVFGDLTVVPVDGSVPLVYLKCQMAQQCFVNSDEGVFVNPNIPFILIGVCEKNCQNPVSAAFVVECIVEKHVYRIVDETYYKSYKNKIKIEPTIFDLSPVHQIMVTLLTTNGKGETGWSKMLITQNQSPENGSCSISPKLGQSFETQFLISCIGWEDKDTVQNYRYILDDGNSVRDIMVSNAPYLFMVLPSGYPERNFSINMYAGIRDRYEAETIVFIDDITVEPACLTAEELNTKQEIVKAEVSHEQLLSFIQTVSSFSRSNDGSIPPSLSDSLPCICNSQYFRCLNDSLKDKCSNDTTPYNKTMCDEQQQAESLLFFESISKLLADQISMVKAEEINPAADAAFLLMTSTKTFGIKSKENIHTLLEKVGDVAENRAGAIFSDKLNQTTFSIIRMASTFSQIINRDLSSPLHTDKQYMFDKAVASYDSSLPLDPSEIAYEERKTEDEYKAFAADKHQRKLGGLAAGTVMNIMTALTDQQIKNHLPNEPPYSVNTNDAKLIMKFASNKTNESLLAVNDKVNIALPTASFCTSDCDKIYTKALYFENNLHTYADKNSQLTTGSIELSYHIARDDRNGEQIYANNLSHPVALEFDSGLKPADSVPQFIHPKLQKCFLFSTHKINVNPFSAIFIQINKTNEDAYLKLLINYQDNPGSENYNWTIDFPPNKTNMVWFLDNDHLDNKGGVYYLGIGEIWNDENDDNNTHIIEKVDCPETEGPFREGGFNYIRNFTTDYSLLIHTPSCLFVNKSKYEGSGCRVLNRTTLWKVHCECTHLTTFAAGLIVPPNKLDFDFIFKNASFLKNITIYMSLIIFSMAYILLMIWGRRKDNKDLELVQMTPVRDNKPVDKYIYEISVRTGIIKKASTKSKVSFILCGGKSSTGTRDFNGLEKYQLFKRGSIDRFVLTVSKPLGSLQWIRVWHDNSGKGQFASWYLDDITVIDLQSKEKFVFVCHKWFAVEKSEKVIERTLPVSSKAGVGEWDHAFITNIKKKFTDGHLWFSVFARPLFSRFTRCERITCCFCVLLSSMLVSAMWYDKVPPNSEGIQLGPFSVSSAELGVGIMSNLIVFPINFLIVFMFRKSSLQKKRPSQIKQALISAGHNLKMLLGNSNIETDYSKMEKKKKKFLLPWYCRYIGWVLSSSLLLISLLFVLFYAIQFQDQKTRKWITSLFLGFVTSALLTQPIKIVLMVTLFAIIFKKPEEEDEDRWDDEEEFTTAYCSNGDETDGPTEPQDNKAEYHATDPHKLAAFAQIRALQEQMFDIIREMSTYFMFLLILLVLVYGNRSKESFLVQNNLRRLFLENNYNKINNVTTFWKWANSTLAVCLRAAEYYNGDPPNPSDRGFIKDRVNRLMGFALMRQVRIRRNSCSSTEKIKQPKSKECLGFASVLDEDRENYGPKWVRSPVNEERSEYIYKSTLKLNTLPIVGTVDSYSGGGYPLLLTGSVQEMQARFQKLAKERWIDQRTRAIVIEFFLYNANSNLFTVNQITFEFPPIGGIFKTAYFQPVRLLRYETNGWLTLSVEILFILYFLVFVIKEARNVKKEKLAYFKQLWNYLEMMLIVFSLLAITCYFLRHVATAIQLKKFQASEGNEYTNYSYIGALDQAFTILMGFILYTATLKFCRLLRFNKNIALVTRVLKSCRSELLQFGIVSFVLYMAYSILFYFLLFEVDEEFSSIPKSMEETLSMILCKVPFSSFRNHSPYIGAFAFFTFSVMIIAVTVNIFVTILNLYETTIRTDSAKQMNDFEIAGFTWRQIKNYVGFMQAPSETMDVENALDTPNVFEEVEEKLDKMLHYINKHFMYGALDDILEEKGSHNGGTREIKCSD